MGRHHPLNGALGTASPLGFSVFCKFPTRNSGPLSSSSWRGGGERRAPRTNTSLTDLDSRRARWSLWGAEKEEGRVSAVPAPWGTAFPRKKMSPSYKTRKKRAFVSPGARTPRNPTRGGLSSATRGVPQMVHKPAAGRA